MDDVRITPAGDGFYARGLQAHDDQDECPFCFAGYVTITVEEDGEEHDEPVHCRRCNREDG